MIESMPCICRFLVEERFLKRAEDRLRDCAKVKRDWLMVDGSFRRFDVLVRG